MVFRFDQLTTSNNFIKKQPLLSALKQEKIRGATGHREQSVSLLVWLLDRLCLYHGTGSPVRDAATCVRDDAMIMRATCTFIEHSE
jgi:hypothetical protein